MENKRLEVDGIDAIRALVNEVEEKELIIESLKDELSSSDDKITDLEGQIMMLNDTISELQSKED